MINRVDNLSLNKHGTINAQHPLRGRTGSPVWPFFCPSRVTTPEGGLSPVSGSLGRVEKQAGERSGVQSPPLRSQPSAVRTVAGFRRGIPKRRFFSPKYAYSRKAPVINEF